MVGSMMPWKKAARRSRRRKRRSKRRRRKRREGIKRRRRREKEEDGKESRPNPSQAEMATGDPEHKKLIEISHP